jgi:hypothetical protein
MIVDLEAAADICGLEAELREGTKINASEYFLCRKNDIGSYPKRWA